MKKYRTSSIYLDKCMRTIEQNCLMNPTGSFHGADLSAFCSKPKNVYALHLLAASGDILIFRPLYGLKPKGCFALTPKLKKSSVPSSASLPVYVQPPSFLT